MDISQLLNPIPGGGSGGGAGGSNMPGGNSNGNIVFPHEVPQREESTYGRSVNLRDPSKLLNTYNNRRV